MIEVRLDSVRVNRDEGKYVLLLQEKDGTRVVVPWVGQWDADAAAHALKSVQSELPQPHDLQRFS